MAVSRDIYIAVISTGRAGAVSDISQHVGQAATWYVGMGEGGAYRAAGAENVVEAGGLMESRNLALDSASELGMPCLQLSDDLAKVRTVDAGVVPFEVVVERLHRVMRESRAKLAGVAPTDNAFYYSANRPVSTHVYILGDCMLIDSSTHLRFDPALRLKEDYDYTLQHLQAYGLVARDNGILLTFRHRTNPGGAVDYRTPELEQQTIEYLKGKWGANIKDNPRRPNEILLSIRKGAPVASG